MTHGTEARDNGPSAAAYLPKAHTLKALRDAAVSCRGCDLYRYATQTVFGEGKASARLMFVGEQPGDREDREGRPFVGPAGTLLRKALAEAEIDERGVYITNAVKHFKFVERGKRRIHAKPKVIEVRACRPWLRAEIAAVKPGLVVALGATAALSLLGPQFRLTQHRGEVFPSDFGARVVATIHPSAILRSPDSETRRAERARFIADLRKIGDALRRVS